MQNLLKRDAKDRIHFEAFFNHPFLNPPQPKPEPAPVSRAEAVSVPERAAGAGAAGSPCQLPPSPAASRGVVSTSTSSTPRMETSETEVRRPGQQREQGSSPETDQVTTYQHSENTPALESRLHINFQDCPGFVMVPNSLAGDSSRNKNSTGVSPLTARRIGARPGSLPALTRTHNTDPIPVPTQRAAYQAIQVLDWLIYSM